MDKLRIEELLDRNASDLEISKELRNIIQEYFSTLDALFAKTQGKDFLVRHTRYIDSIITTIYRIAIRKLFGIYAPLSNAIPITLVALGSYGREQLAPYSDIDLMIVYEDVEGFNTRAIIEKILYIIWDTKLKLGHRVHKVDELQEVAKEDDTIKTALLESRFIVGSKFLWYKIENELNKIRHYKQKEYIFAKIDEAKKRHKKFPVSMEPNIKEGLGGLRDSNLLFWIATSIYGVRSLRELSGKLFSDDEYKEYRIALEWLFRVRAALHLVAGKKEDRLLFQYIPEVADKLEVKGANAQKKQQNVVTKTLQAMHIIEVFSKIFVKKMVRPYLYDGAHLHLLRSKRIAPKIYACNGIFYASYFTQDLPLKNLLQLLSTHEPRSFDPSFIHFAKGVQASKILSKTNAKLIKKLFYKKHLFPILQLLYEADLLPVVVPPLKKVMFMPQFDGYHRYPVDLHSLACVQALENIHDPFLQELHASLSADEQALLKLVVLLHDSGKGRRQRHHEVGAKLFRVYAEKLGFSDELIEMGAVLIKQHTAMTETAYNKDIHNEKVVLSFLAPLKSKKLLDMLYLLTYADINGVGRNVYTSYNAKLLRELYTLSLEALNRTEILDEVQKRLRKERSLQRSEKFKALPRLLQRKILSIASNLFFIKHNIDEIIEISRLAYETKEFRYKISNDAFLRIEIIRRTPINLGYLLGKLSYLDIASMEVFKLFDDLKYFRIEFMEKYDGDLGLIEQIIEESFDMSKKIELVKPIIKPEEIAVDCNHSKTYALMSITTRNQKGLLAYIAKVFDKYGIDIATAKIYTIKGKAKDMFLIEKNGNFCTQTEKILEKLTQGSKVCAES